ncbi:flagellar biosynthesis anti-sigma factor FlgM [Natronincola ferrireducens]|uniref:Negative regulator of flagellin synthesis n=1 Tax=Natronincola ferrireducens TaxID=393762 RepID=A0A1G8XKB5_9FIRM|nr:flagellar biosynthesis anti-sigma factor FlgM [Natronincola ferrireducens]SDJ91029.1 anti-sigma-28 factor, FlgM family [Natronincola ferrireducens]
MKIYNNPNINKIMEVYNKTSKSVEKTNQVQQTKDKLEISQSAKEFQIAMQAFKNLPEVREEKLKEIKEKIETNSYNISGKEIANKILEGIMIDKKL